MIASTWLPKIDTFQFGHSQMYILSNSKDKGCHLDFGENLTFSIFSPLAEEKDIFWCQNIRNETETANVEINTIKTT